MENIKITWYGHCAFLIEIEKTKILIDPFDHFNNIHIGDIEADFLLLSSVAHDHGNIAASVKAWTHHHAGTFNLPNDIKVTGIETKEYRGTPNIIFNIEHKNLSITNFADLGDEDSLKNIHQKDIEVMEKTNLAFMRHNRTLDPEIHSYDLSLKVSNPNVIIPIHFYPKSFIESQIPKDEREGYLEKLVLIDQMLEKLKDYKVKFIEDHSIELSQKMLENKTILYFQKIHPQVRHIK